jgi:hypothetical protein
MNIDDPLRSQLLAIFGHLNTVAAARGFPAPATLSATLQNLIPTNAPARRNIDASAASYFATAATDIWLRGVHSFLVSASLTQESPIWASVSGYYSSHYAVRGLAHLLGYFQLFRNKRIVQLTLVGGRYVCTFNRKSANDAEHKLYWKLVKQSAVFASDAFLTLNSPDSELSDVRHRNHANYSDHLSLYPVFKPLDIGTLKARIEYISKIAFDAAPLPRFSKFPDLEYVQLIAYHRIVKFRRLLDEVLGGKNRFWSVHRNPSFAMDFMTFQLTEGTGLSQPDVR